MKTLALSTLAAVAALSAAPAVAQDGPSYNGSIGYSRVTTEGTDANLDALTARFGARFNPYLGAEGEASIGVNGEEVAPGVDVELDHQFAVYGVAFAPVSENLDLFARLGYGQSELSVSGPGFGASEDGESWNYGVGAQYFFDGANGVRGDWTRHDFKDDGGEADVFSVSYVRKF